MIYDMIFDICH